MVNQSHKLSGPFLIELKNKFREIAGADNKIDRQEFKNSLVIKNEKIINRIFDIFDKDENNVLDINEFINGIETLIESTNAQKIKFAFDIHDFDGSGDIDEDELKIKLTKIEIIENTIHMSVICTTKFAGYLIKTTRSNGEVWQTWKRYSEFYKLNDILKQESELIIESILDAITFPGKRFFNRLNPKHITQRQSSLETYLNQLLNITLIAEESLQFRDFLSPFTRYDWTPREIDVNEYKDTGNKIREISDDKKKKQKKNNN